LQWSILEKKMHQKMCRWWPLLVRVQLDPCVCVHKNIIDPADDQFRTDHGVSILLEWFSCDMIHDESDKLESNCHVLQLMIPVWNRQKTKSWIIIPLDGWQMKSWHKWPGKQWESC
jgi:hypothetical protein